MLGEHPPLPFSGGLDEFGDEFIDQQSTVGSVDTAGAGINMVTCSVPVYADAGRTRLLGVVTADVSLDR